MVSWSLPGDRTLFDICEEARKAGSKLEIVSGFPPPFSGDCPWARKVEIVRSDHWTVWVKEDGREVPIEWENIFEARLMKSPDEN